MAAPALSLAASPAHIDKVEKLKRWEDAFNKVTEQLKKGAAQEGYG